MKKIWLTIFLLAVSTTVHAQLRVVTTTPDLAAIAQEIGGDLIEVTAIAKGYQDPHYVQAKPSYMRLLNRADLLIYTGLELEIGWLPTIIQGARNPKIAPGAKGHLNASVGISPLEIPSGPIDRSMGDIHPEGNPHYLLSPKNGLIVAETITTKLSKLSPENSNIYQENLKRFQRDLQQKINKWETRLSHLHKQKIVTYHKLWEYLADWLQLDIVDQVEHKPGVPPSPRHIAQLISRMQTDRISLLICSNLVDPKPARKVATHANAQVLILPASVGGEPAIKTYTDLFEHIVSHLETATQGQ